MKRRLWAVIDADGNQLFVWSSTVEAYVPLMFTSREDYREFRRRRPDFPRRVLRVRIEVEHA